jgi:hypothetical protein
MIYRIDPKSWMVEYMFPTVGYRPHGVGIETPDARFLWESDTNMGAFFKRDMVSGAIVDSIQLPEAVRFHTACRCGRVTSTGPTTSAAASSVCRMKI